MSNYVELLRRKLSAYRDDSNGFHTPDSAKKITDAIAGFAFPLDELGEVIKKQRAGLYANSEFEIASRDVLRVLDAQIAVLEAANRSAARADRVKIQQIVVDRHVAEQKAKVQQAADAELVKQIKKLISEAHSDVTEAGGQKPDDGGFGVRGKPGRINLEELKRSIDERAVPKEDAILAAQLALIGGQASPT